MLNDVRKVVFKIKEFLGAQYILTLMILDGVRMCVDQNRFRNTHFVYLCGVRLTLRFNVALFYSDTCAKQLLVVMHVSICVCVTVVFIQLCRQ